MHDGLVRPNVIAAVDFWAIVLFAMVSVVILGLQYGKVMFDESYSFKRMLRDLAVIGLLVGAILSVMSLLR